MSKKDLENYWVVRDEFWTKREEILGTSGALNMNQTRAFFVHKATCGAKLEQQDPIALDIAQVAERVQLLTGAGPGFARRLSFRLYDAVTAAKSEYVSVSNGESLN